MPFSLQCNLIIKIIIVKGEIKGWSILVCIENIKFYKEEYGYEKEIGEDGRAYC